MTRPIHARIAFAVALVGLASPAFGQALSHTQSVYVDEKNVGFKAPEGVACRDAVAVVADTGNKRLVRYAIKDGAFAGGTDMRSDQVVSPTRVQLDSKGNTLALDLKTRKIAKFDPKGAFTGFVEIKGAGANSVIDAFKLDAGDRIYALDGGTRKVLVLDAAGSITRQIALPKGGTFTDLVEAGGKVFAIEAITATVFSAEPAATSFEPLSKSLKDVMSFPAYMTVRGGALFIVDQYGHGLVTVGLDGVYRGRQLAMGWGNGLVYYPAQVCVSEGGIAVADRYNNRVQVFAGLR